MYGPPRRRQFRAAGLQAFSADDGLPAQRRLTHPDRKRFGRAVSYEITGVTGRKYAGPRAPCAEGGHFNPEAYLRYVSERIAEHPINKVEELLPRNVAEKLMRSATNESIARQLEMRRMTRRAESETPRAGSSTLKAGDKKVPVILRSTLMAQMIPGTG